LARHPERKPKTSQSSIPNEESKRASRRLPDTSYIQHPNQGPASLPPKRMKKSRQARREVFRRSFNLTSGGFALMGESKPYANHSAMSCFDQGTQAIRKVDKHRNSIQLPKSSLGRPYSKMKLLNINKMQAHRSTDTPIKAHE